MERGTFYITTAIPYVNAAPHIGHVLEFLQTDAIARYQKSLGKDVALVTGADENSLKNVHAAEKQGITPSQLCDRNSAVFEETAKKVGLSFTVFRRTSDKDKHWPGVQRVWDLCNERGDLYKKKYRGLYCVGCEAFYEPEELLDGICPEHKTAPEEIEEENYFFRLSRYQERLAELVEKDELRVVPETRKNEVLSFIRGGLKDFSVSRSVVRARGWGVPVPDDPKQIQYVWFDALGTYLTGVGYGTDEKTFTRYWPADVHVIGKGILRFHAVYWPAMLLSAGLELPKTIFVHGYITVEGQKMSKSLGNVIDPLLLVDRYGLDPLRYCLLSEVPTFEDGDFSEKVLMEMNNNELLANLGNLVNRTLVFIKNNHGGIVPSGELSSSDEGFIGQQKGLFGEITKDLDCMKLKEALHKIMAFSKNANKYFQDNKPWELVKTQNTGPGTGRARADAVIGVLASQVKDLSILIGPFLPDAAAEISAQLALEPGKWADVGKPLEGGHQIGEPKPIFRKLEAKGIEGVREKIAVEKEKAGTRFADLDLEVGEILSAEKHPDAEKLFVEKVRLGDGDRQIVSGLSGHYLPEELVGRKVVILRNLATAKLRGVESQGMLLAAEGHERAPMHDGKSAQEEGAVEVIFPANSKVGDKVFLKGEKPKPKDSITFKDFQKVKIEVLDFFVFSEGKSMVTSSGEELRMKNVKRGLVG
ncbi:MAG: methionine--tRNA ligase [Candidatus Micrarchaeota archaeon]